MTHKAPSPFLLASDTTSGYFGDVNAKQTLTWTVDSKDHKIARNGDLVLFMDRQRVNYGRGDKRNGYVWFAKVINDVTNETTVSRRQVTGKRDAASLLA